MIPIPSLKPYLVYAKGAAVLILILLLCAQVEKCTASKYEARIYAMKADFADNQRRAEAQAREKEQADQAFTDLIAQQGYEALREKEKENEALRSAVASRDKRLLVKVACPVPAAAQEADPGRVDSGAVAQLHPDSEQDYHALRTNIIRTEEALKACQKLVMP